VVRATAIAYAVALDGSAFRDSPHPGLTYDPISPQGIFGIHMASRRFSAHVNYYYYRDPPFESANPVTDLSWGNITLEYRF
jgi:hypothetical protein